MGQYLNEPFTFLIDVLFGLYILIVMLRFLFQLFKVDFYNPISQAIVKFTNPPLRILRRFIPSIGKIDASSIVLMLTLQFIAFSLIFLIQGVPFLPLAILLLSLAELLNLVFNIFIFSVIILAVLSWFGAASYHNPLAILLEQLTRPVLNPVRRRLPTAGGIDFSPMLVIIGLIFLKLLLIPPLQGLVRHIPM